jgi:hypothetical protein
MRRTESDMTDRSDLMRRAEDLRAQAERESDDAIRDRLVRMADRYVHLAESRAMSDSHPVSVASVSELFINQDRTEMPRSSGE